MAVGAQSGHLPCIPPTPNRCTWAAAAAGAIDLGPHSWERRGLEQRCGKDLGDTQRDGPQAPPLP